MRIAIDSRFLLPHLEGFGRFTKEIASRLVRQHPEVEWDLLFDRKPLSQYHFGSSQKSIVLPPQTRHWSLYEVWWRISVPFYLRKRRPSALFATYGIISSTVGKRIPTAAFIHDLGFVRYPEFIPRGWWHYYMRAMGAAVRHSRILIANSQSVLADLVELFGAEASQIRVAYNGCDTEFFRPLPDLDTESIRRRYAAGYPYLLYVGSIHPRKNPERLLEAYDLLRRRYTEPLRLLFVGRFMFRKSETLRYLSKMRHAEEVLFHPPVQDEELRSLYNASAVVVYPSLYEGFGYPVAEALACGAAVVTSSVSSLPEVGGEAAFYADPYDPASIAEAIYQALTQSPEEKSRRAELGRTHIQQFSWERTTQVIWESLKAIAS